MKIIVKFLLSITLISGYSLLLNHSDSEEFPYSIGEPDPSWVIRTIGELSLREKIGQLIQVRVRGEFLNSQSTEFKELQRSVQQHHVGGVVLFAGNVYESAHLLNELQSQSKLPLLVSADFERGASFRIEGTTSFPWTMAVGATGSEEFAYQQGMITARESRALGVHWILAPVMDVNNNPSNPVINIRSFGEDPQLVGRLGTAFIRGVHAGGAMSTAKHFPGHGDTTADTHIGLAVIPSNIERLQSMELVPFKSAIEAGVDAIMTAHVALPEISSDPEIPATLSNEILTDLLRKNLKFDGLIVTDAMEMGGITNRYWCGLAAIEAIKAGADIVLLPTDTLVAVNEIERAVERGDISPARIDASVRKVLWAKSRLGLNRQRTVSIRDLSQIIASPDSQMLAQEIADRSITVIKDTHRILPVDPADDPDVYSLVLDSGLATSPGSVFQNALRTLYPSVITEWANARISSEQIQKIQRQAARSDLIICSTFARLSSGRNISAIPDDQQTIVRNLMNTGKPIVWIAFGNPYVLERFPEIETYLCTFSYSDVSQRAAAKAISGEIPVSGKMPVSIPGHASVGDGLQREPYKMELNPSPGEAVSSSSDLRDSLGRLLRSFMESGILSDAQILVGHQSSTVVNVNTREENAFNAGWPMWAASSRFGVTFSSMLATESHNLLLDAPVQDYIPEFQNTDVNKHSVSELLTDISGTSQMYGNREASNQIVMQQIVLRACGLRTLDGLIDRLFFSPLALSSSFQYPSPTPFTGSFDAYDLAAISQLLLNKGIYFHHRILKPDTIARFTDPSGGGKALGWIKPEENRWTGTLFSPSAFGCMDANGHFLWIEPEEKLFIVLSAEGVSESKENRIETVYENIAEAVLQEISSKK